MPAAADLLVAAGDVLDDDLGVAPGLQVAVAVREADDRAGVADVDVPGLRAGRMEGDAERAVELLGEDRAGLRPAVAVGVAEDAEAVGPALGDEQVAVGGAHDDAGLLQARGELGHLEALRCPGPGPLGPA